MNTPGIIILAAGLGARFRQAGGVGNKLLAPLADGALLLEQTLAHAQASGLPPVVVTRPEYAEILTLAQAGWLIVPGDMAWITAEDHRRVAQALAEGAEQVRLCWQGLPGHPVGFSAAYRERLLALRGDCGARALLDPALLRAIDAHPGVIRDADLPGLSGRF
ncbi:NTP transferase domain-containing protein [Pluralibacter gergoviae]|uniref:nucleotidyltransferase family protein n=1 Tax=Pluralibacter gergoviae TaxID=61647 RepID=UPI00291030D2|nr:NTP transferase domain-containing protein [Pluralibacter gergoviae]MDU4002422.1 NTP transferase domain-containing protein [Pluralibacter gergoviae]